MGRVWTCLPISNSFGWAMFSCSVRVALVVCVFLGQPLLSAGPSLERAGEKVPNGSKNSKVDRYGDPLPEGAIARLGTVRLRQGAEINSLVFSGDGKMLLTGGDFGQNDLRD